MFHSARIKLTSWYLLIIMTISIFFSLLICRVFAFELERGFKRFEHRLRLEGLGLRRPLINSPLFGDDLRFAKRRVVIFLLEINGVIFVISALAGYFLAGKTLEPIERVMGEQKRFVADASHELRTPLTALKTSIEVTLREKRMTTKEARIVLESSLKDINSLQSLTDNLLNLSRQGNNNLVFRQTDIGAVIRKAYRKVVPLVKKKNINLELILLSKKAEVDRSSLEEMLVIFLDNAVKYTPKGGRIAITMKPEKKNIVIKIKDSGVGISEKDIPHIFDRFYRADQSRSKQSVVGFGLGLSLAKRIIKNHKGSVKVSSALGKGTTFTIKFPLKHG